MKANTLNSSKPSRHSRLLDFIRENQRYIGGGTAAGISVGLAAAEDPGYINLTSVPEVQEVLVEESALPVENLDVQEQTDSGLSIQNMNEILRAAKQVDLNTDPGAALLNQLKDNGNLNPTISGLADTYSLINSTPKVASVRYSYQVKEAFSLSEETIAEYKDREGPIKVKLRDGKFVDLSFKETDVQSRLNLQMPDRPHLKYIQTMLLPTLLVSYEDINNILLLGMGGGTLAKYYTQFYPTKRKTIVDLRPILFDVSQEHFMYTPDRSTELIPGDASIFLSKARAKKKLYDIINVDIFIEGPSDLLLNHFFWSNAASVLSKKGVCASNIWKGDYIDKYNKIVDHHKSIFTSVFEVLNTETEQVALCGSHLPFELLFNSFSEIKAIEITGLTGINFKQHINNVRRLK